MKSLMMTMFGVGFCAATAAGVWLSTQEEMDAAGAPPVAAQTSAPSAPADGNGTSLWSWGDARVGDTAGARTDAIKAAQPLPELLAQALRASGVAADGNDARDKLRQLAAQDPAFARQLIASYDKQSISQVRELIVAVLSGVDRSEVRAFSKRLALSDDIDQRRDGFSMLQHASGDSPELRSIVLQTLSRDKTPEGIMLALATLKPPGAQSQASSGDAAAIVAQLQELSKNADPNIRQQSILQLAQWSQWDKAGRSQDQLSQALTDQSLQVREAAIIAIVQSGAQSDAVKAALINVANNQNESKDIRGNALQVLEGFALNKDEAENFSQLRAQVLGL